MRHLPDHGLPLVQLKEQRRDLVVALQNRVGPVSGWELMQIAAVQQAISAFEDVIADLDAEMEMEAAASAADLSNLLPGFRRSAIRSDVHPSFAGVLHSVQRDVTAAWNSLRGRKWFCTRRLSVRLFL